MALCTIIKQVPLPNSTYEALPLQVPGGHFLLIYHSLRNFQLILFKKHVLLFMLQNSILENGLKHSIRFFLLRYYVATLCPFHIATTLWKGPSIKYVHRIFGIFTSERSSGSQWLILARNEVRRRWIGSGRDHIILFPVFCGVLGQFKNYEPSNYIWHLGI